MLNEAYAEQIARDWNATSDPFAGYVTRFEVSEPFVERFERRVVGGRQHEELWVPAEQLPEFNVHIVGTITVTGAFFGSSFRGSVPGGGAFAGLDARGQLAALERLGERPRELSACVANHAPEVFLHFPFWAESGVPEALLDAITKAWAALHPSIPLGPSRSKA